MPIKVLLESSPLSNAHAIRGVGAYTRFLSAALEKEPEVELQRSAVQEKSFKPDIIHYPFFDLFFPTLPLFRKAKTVVTIHDVIPLRYPRFYPVGKRGALAFLKQRLALQSVDAVITDSEASKTDIMRYLRIPAEKIHVVMLAANPELKTPDEKTLARVRRRWHLPEKYLLYVGDINYNKNIPQLIKTLKYLPKNVKLVCLGKNFFPQNIPEWQWIESQIALSNVQNRVIFLTQILGDALEDISAIYHASLAYIQPSLYEGFGLPILEAMRCQTPVICAENSSLPEVANTHALFVPEAKAEDFAKAVEKLLSWSARERSKWLEAAKRWESTFTWKKSAEATLSVYQKLLEKK